MPRLKLFVSHISPTGEEREWTRDFSDELRNHGLDVFEYLQTDEDPPLPVIEDALRNTDSIVMVMENEHLNAGIFAFETGVAITGEKDLVAIISPDVPLDEIELPPVRQSALRRESPAATADNVIARLRGTESRVVASITSFAREPPTLVTMPV